MGLVVGFGGWIVCCWARSSSSSSGSNSVHAYAIYICLCRHTHIIYIHTYIYIHIHMGRFLPSLRTSRSEPEARVRGWWVSGSYL